MGTQNVKENHNGALEMIKQVQKGFVFQEGDYLIYGGIKEDKSSKKAGGMRVFYLILGRGIDC